MVRGGRESDLRGTEVIQVKDSQQLVGEQQGSGGGWVDEMAKNAHYDCECVVMRRLWTMPQSPGLGVWVQGDDFS